MKQFNVILASGEIISFKAASYSEKRSAPLMSDDSPIVSSPEWYVWQDDNGDAVCELRCCHVIGYYIGTKPAPEKE